jgi:hypothetical protein
MRGRNYGVYYRRMGDLFTLTTIMYEYSTEPQAALPTKYQLQKHSPILRCTRHAASILRVIAHASVVLLKISLLVRMRLGFGTTIATVFIDSINEFFNLQYSYLSRAKNDHESSTPPV